MKFLQNTPTFHVPDYALTWQLSGLQGLDRFRLNDERMRALSGLTSLRSLFLAWHEAVTDVGIQALTSLTTLEKLTVHRGWRATDAGLAHVWSLSNLRELTMTSCGKDITAAGLRGVTRLTNLKKLALSDFPQIQKSTLQGLSSMTTLEELEIDGKNVPVKARGVTNNFDTLFDP